MSQFGGRPETRGRVLTAPRSPRQNPYCERVIGTLRRECLDDVIVLGEQYLRRILRRYLEYYHGSRTHLALDGEAPESRERESTDEGKAIVLPMGRQAASSPHPSRSLSDRLRPTTNVERQLRAAQADASPGSRVSRPRPRKRGLELPPLDRLRGRESRHLAANEVLRKDRRGIKLAARG